MQPYWLMEKILCIIILLSETGSVISIVILFSFVLKFVLPVTGRFKKFVTIKNSAIKHMHDTNIRLNEKTK